MKSYSFCIIDSEGENILDKEITADEVIAFLLSERYAKEQVIEGYNAPITVSVGDVPDVDVKKKGGKIRCKKCGEKGHFAKTCKSGVQAVIDIEQGPGANLPDLVKQSVLKRFKAGMDEDEIWREVDSYMTRGEFKEALEWAKLQ